VDVLAAMIPLVYGYSSLQHHGVWRDFRFDDAQRLELLLTLCSRVSRAAAREHGVRLARRHDPVRPMARAVPAADVARRDRGRVRHLDGDPADRIRGPGHALLAPKYFWETVRKQKRSAASLNTTRPTGASETERIIEARK